MIKKRTVFSLMCIIFALSFMLTNKNEKRDDINLKENFNEKERYNTTILLEQLMETEILTSETGTLRKFPYPYKAMLAICSDSDCITQEYFEKMHRFLNTTSETEYGTGLGLDISDSFFVYNATDLYINGNFMTYCEGTDPDRIKDGDIIKKYYQCGWIDSIHTFGDFSRRGETLFSRNLALSAWNLLEREGIAPIVWIDHGTNTNVQNFGAYNPKNASSYQMGDNPKSPYYHTDITLNHSIKYIWHSRHSDQFGRDFPLEEKILRDGKKVWAFSRYTSNMLRGQIDWLWNPDRIGDQISEEQLDQLEKRGQYSILAQHLCLPFEWNQLGEADVQALRMLAKRFHETKTILVARTSRLLNYAVSERYMQYQMVEQDGVLGIRILSINDPVFGMREANLGEIRGVTFYCEKPENVSIFLGDELLDQNFVLLNQPDETERWSVSIAWFDPDTYDYTME